MIGEGAVIEVVLRWSGDVVEVTHVDGKLTIGRGVDDDLFVPLECVESIALVEKDPRGFTLNIPRGMRGFVARSRVRIDVPADGMTIALDDDVRAHLASGPFTLEVRKARRSRLPLLAPIFDAMWANTAALTLASMGILVAFFSLGSAHDDATMPLTARTTIPGVRPLLTPCRPPPSASRGSPASPPECLAAARSRHAHRIRRSRAVRTVGRRGRG